MDVFTGKLDVLNKDDYQSVKSGNQKMEKALDKSLSEVNH